MDEAGFPPSATRPQRVIGRRGKKGHKQQGGACHENVTALVTICADGTNVTPLVIFKGQNFMKKWGVNNPIGAAYVVSHFIL